MKKYYNFTIKYIIKRPNRLKTAIPVEGYTYIGLESDDHIINEPNKSSCCTIKMTPKPKSMDVSLLFIAFLVPMSS